MTAAIREGWVVLVAPLAMMIAASQQKPDFSGEWTLNREASTLSPAASGIRSGTWRIEHREPLFRYQAKMIADGNPIEYAYELSTDGREVAATQGGRSSVSSLRWDGDALVFTGVINGQTGDLRITFRYELQDGGRRLRAVEQIRGTREQDNVWIFERQ